MVFKYDQDADILSIEVSKNPIDYAQEIGDLVVHFSAKNKPVLLEILNVKNFFKKSFKLLPAKERRIIFRAV